MRFRSIVCATALTAALAAAGCGSGDDFTAGYNDAVEPLATLTERLQAGDAGAGELRRMARELEAVGGRLRELSPPDDAREELDRMIAALDAGAVQVRKLARAVGAQDPEKLASAAGEFADGGTELVAAEQALRAAVEG